MNKQEREECQFLRTLSSAEAADWLIENYTQVPISFAHRSWKKKDQMRLANHFLKDALPFASAYGYEMFLKVMSAHSFLSALKKHIPDIKGFKRDLLKYYLIPTVKKYIQTERDQIAFQSILETLQD